jgi:predicted RNase H-like nuclease (RuvC/YqgF family)
VSIAPLGPLATEKEKTTVAWEETPETGRFEEHPEPSSSSAAPAMTKPLTEATMIEKEVMSTIAQIESQLEERPNLQLLDLDTTSFLGIESMGTASADILSDIYSVYAEPKFETHEDAQNALYAAAGNLCQSITYYKPRTTSLEQTIATLEMHQQEAKMKAEETAAEIANLQREKDALKQTLANKQRSVEKRMAAKLSRMPSDSEMRIQS